MTLCTCKQSKKEYVVIILVYFNPIPPDLCHVKISILHFLQSPRSFLVRGCIRINVSM